MADLKSHRFIAEPVQVELAGDPALPARFVWRGRSLEITQVLQLWSDWHFGEGTHRRSWRNRRHRDYFRVRTDLGVFDLYRDRSAPEGSWRWILHQELVADGAGNGTTV